MRARSVSCKVVGGSGESDCAARLNLASGGRGVLPGVRITPRSLGTLPQVPHWLESAVPPRGLVLQKTRDDYHYGAMQTVFEAAGGMDGLRRLADAWHRRVTADDVVGHAFSHGFHPQHVERLAAYWAEALGAPARIPTPTVTRPPSSRSTAATGSTTKWIAVRLPASTRL